MELIQQKLNQFADEDEDEESESHRFFYEDSSAGLPLDLARQKKIERGLLRRLGTLVAMSEFQPRDDPTDLRDAADAELDDLLEEPALEPSSTSRSSSGQQTSRDIRHDSSRSISFEPATDETEERKDKDKKKRSEWRRSGTSHQL